jgi:protein-tyrosine phosphatase
VSPRLRVVAVAAALALVACGGDDGGTSTSSPATAASATPTTTAPTTTIAIDGDETTTAPAPGATTTAPPTTLVPPTTLAATPAITDAEVTRSADGSQLTISWVATTSAPVDVRWGPTPDAIDQPVAGLRGYVGSSATIPDPAPGARAFFRIAAGDGGVTVAERRVVLEGQPNFRDLGGYVTADGRSVKWGQIYRSGELGKLTEADLAVIDRIGIALVCDLRSDSEVAALPDPAGAADEQLRLAVNDESVDVAAITAAITAGDLSSLSPTLLLDGMPKVALDFTANWRDLLLRISDPTNRPTNFHCTAGKDRAGWASAMVLRALGVPEETVMADYLLSNDYRAEANAATIAQVRTLVAAVNGVPEDEVDMSNLVALLDVRPEYLQAAFDAVDAAYGSFDAYLTDGLGLTAADVTALRDGLLE